MDDEIKKQDAHHERTSHREHQRDTSELSTPNLTAPKSPPYAEHGPLIDRSQTAENITKKAYNAGLMWPRIRHYCRQPFSEFMGTFILIMFGDGVVAQVTLSNKQGGDYQSISWGWVRLSLYTADPSLVKLTAD